MKVRLVDIARAAGVSPATVDRVMNNRKGVHARTSARVQAAALRLSRGDLAPQAQTKRFDFLIPSGPTASSFLETMAQDVPRMQEQWALIGVEPHCHRVEGFHAPSIAERLRSMAADSNGICVVAIDHPLVREAINDVVAGGVPVVTLVTDISSSRRIGYVGVDNYAAGRLSGYLMGRFLAGRGGDIALIAGSLTYQGHQEREAGFRRILREDFAKLNIVDLREGQDDTTHTYEQALELLDANPALVGIYNIGGGSVGVAQAMQERQRTDIVFIAHELNAATRADLVGGVIDAVINQNATQELNSAVRMLLNHHAGRDVRSNVEPIRIEVFVRENLPWTA
jgi:LacI family transcriptional regulator